MNKPLRIYEDGKLLATVSRNDLHNTFSVKNHKPHFVPSYKNLYKNQLATNKGLLIANGVLALTTVGVIVGCSIRIDHKQAELNTLQHEFDRTMVIADANVISYNKLESELASCSAKLPKPKYSQGKVSFYSKDGCLGCSTNQTMANGQIFNENAMTLAHNRIPLNTKVKVINQDNGLFAYATVTDRGGFEKYGRIADLSKGLYEAIGAKTDISNIQITW